VVPWQLRGHHVVHGRCKHTAMENHRDDHEEAEEQDLDEETTDDHMFSHVDFVLCFGARQ
jgi:hypothetical protein